MNLPRPSGCVDLRWVKAYTRGVSQHSAVLNFGHILASTASHSTCKHCGSFEHAKSQSDALTYEGDVTRQSSVRGCSTAELHKRSKVNCIPQLQAPPHGVHIAVSISSHPRPLPKLKAGDTVGYHARGRAHVHRLEIFLRRLHIAKATHVQHTFRDTKLRNTGYNSRVRHRRFQAPGTHTRTTL